MTTPIQNLQIKKTNLRYLLDLIKDEVKREINCHSIGTIQTFDPVTATATVSFNYKKVLRGASAIDPNSTSSTDVIIEYPQLVRVPIIVLGGGGAYTTYPISKGDTCLLLFCDRDIDLWLELGSVQSAPNTPRMHDLSDAVALVGLNPVTKPIPNYSINSVMTVFGQVVMMFTNMIASLVDSTGQRLCQPGFGQPYFGNALPSGWLWMDGSAYSTTVYPTLFAAIGYTYGGGGGSFNVPDMRGRVAVGLDNINGNDAGRLAGNAFTTARDTIGGSIGENLHTMTIAELVSHFHQISDQCNSQSGSGRVTVGGDQPEGTNPFTDYTGGSTPFNVVQPGIMCNWIIKI